jgi:hypothetical protein
MSNLFTNIWVRIAIGWVQNKVVKILTADWFDAKVQVPTGEVAQTAKIWVM